MGPSTMINNSNDDQVRSTSINPQLFTDEIPESVPQDKNPLLQEGKKMVLLKRPEQSKELVEQNVLDSQNTEETSSTELDESELDDSEVPANNELDGFLLAALKSPKDRLLLLKLDQEMERFINDSSRNRLEFPQMNAYQRLIVHRVAQYFKLSHVVDSSKKAVILYKSPETEIPILRFMDLLEQEEEPAPQSLKIMRRADNSQSNQRKGFNDGSGSGSDIDKRLMSIEEREAAYQRARARIFQDSEDKKPTIPTSSEVTNDVPALEQVDSQQSPSQSDSESNKSRSSNTNKAGSGTYVKGVKNNSIRGNNLGPKSNSPRPGNQNTRYTRNTFNPSAPVNNYNNEWTRNPSFPYNNAPSGSNTFPSNGHVYPANPGFMNPYELTPVSSQGRINDRVGGNISNMNYNAPSRDWNPNMGSYQNLPGLWNTQEEAHNGFFYNPQQGPQYPNLPNSNPNLARDDPSFSVQGRPANTYQHSSRSGPGYNEFAHHGSMYSDKPRDNSHHQLWGNKWNEYNGKEAPIQGRQDYQPSGFLPNNALDAGMMGSTSAENSDKVDPSTQTLAGQPGVPGLPFNHNWVGPDVMGYGPSQGHNSEYPMHPQLTGNPLQQNNPALGAQMAFQRQKSPEFLHMSRMNMRGPMVGNQFVNPHVSSAYDVERRPPKTKELFDPNNPISSSSTSQTKPMAAKVYGNVPSRVPRRGANLDVAPLEAGMKSISIASSSRTNSQGARNKKENQLLFDYTIQPYEGVKPTDQPQKPTHILEIYDIIGEPNWSEILPSATIKLISKENIVLAIFKNSQLAREVLESIENSNFKLKPWSPVVLQINATSSSSSPKLEGSNELVTSPQVDSTEIEDS